MLGPYKKVRVKLKDKPLKRKPQSKLVNGSVKRRLSGKS